MGKGTFIQLLIKAPPQAFVFSSFSSFVHHAKNTFHCCLRKISTSLLGWWNGTGGCFGSYGTFYFFSFPGQYPRLLYLSIHSQYPPRDCHHRNWLFFLHNCCKDKYLPTDSCNFLVIPVKQFSIIRIIRYKSNSLPRGFQLPLNTFVAHWTWRRRGALAIKFVQGMSCY